MKRHPFILLAGVLAFFWLAGLLVFVWRVEDAIEPVGVTEPADAIVVLTGGSERVSTGIALLKAGKGKKLFISGVPTHSTLDHILAGQEVAKELRACCIILGHEAESTLGNADETRTWMALEDYHSMRLVTANYHMPRSLMIFRTVMPEIQIIPHPVVPDSVKFDDWWNRPGTASLLVTEYNKYLGTVLHLWTGI